MKRILSQDAYTTEVFHYDEHDDTSYISSHTDVTKIIEANKFQRNTAPMRHQHEVFNSVASIDQNAALHWCRTQGIKLGEFLSDPSSLKRFLNDPDNVAWRTRPGKI